LPPVGQVRATHAATEMDKYTFKIIFITVTAASLKIPAIGHKQGSVATDSQRK
jgi:hypothetical protein